MEQLLTLLTSDRYQYIALAVMLLAIVFGSVKGRHAIPAKGRSLAWTRVPLIALAIVSIGPSAVAVLIFVAYKSGLLQHGSAGYRFSSFIWTLPVDFAVMNWGFAVLYLVTRLTATSGYARAAMWLSAIAMCLPNVLLFFLAPEMIANVFDAGQGIGVVLAMLNMPFWPGPYPAFFDAGFGIGFVISALLAPIPLLGLMGWLGGRWLAGAHHKEVGRDN